MSALNAVEPTRGIKKKPFSTLSTPSLHCELGGWPAIHPSHPDTTLLERGTRGHGRRGKSTESHPRHDHQMYRCEPLLTQPQVDVGNNHTVRQEASLVINGSEMEPFARLRHRSCQA